jgi:RNA polymerase-binding transcription factor DksA
MSSGISREGLLSRYGRAVPMPRDRTHWQEEQELLRLYRDQLMRELREVDQRLQKLEPGDF